jgi:protein RecA
MSKAAASGGFAALAAALTSAIGANDEESMPSHWLDLGYAPLNKILAGLYGRGLAYGRLFETYGPSSSGKTALAQHIMMCAQKAGGVAGFEDFERSFVEQMAKSLGLDTTFPRFIYKRPRTWEEGNFQAAKACETIRKSGVIPDEAPIVWVFDSIAAAMPKSVAEKEIDEYNMNDTTALSRVTSTTLKAMAQYAGDYNAIFMYLNQIRTKPGVTYGDPTTTPGGTSMEFYASGRLSTSRTKVMEGESKDFIGQEIRIKCQKSKFTKPFEETTLRLSFTPEGVAYFDPVFSLIGHLNELGLVEKAGNYLVWEGNKFYPKQLAKKINEDPDQLLKLKALLPKD